MSKTADKAIEMEDKFDCVKTWILNYVDCLGYGSPDREKYCLETIRDNIKDLEFIATDNGVSGVPF